MTVLTLTCAALLVLLVLAVVCLERARQLSNRNSRKNIRRLNSYLDMLPPADPKVRAARYVTDSTARDLAVIEGRS